jgi:hypothetical protein
MPSAADKSFSTKLLPTARTRISPVATSNSNERPELPRTCSNTTSIRSLTQQSLECLHIPLADAQGLAAVLKQFAAADEDCFQARGERGRRVQHPQQRGQRGRRVLARLNGGVAPLRFGEHYMRQRRRLRARVEQHRTHTRPQPDTAQHPSASGEYNLAHARQLDLRFAHRTRP